MPEKDAQYTPKSELPPDFSAYIQRIATDWGALEFHINECIWWLANVRPGLGACITSQIYTLDGRLNALLALLKLRRAPQSLIDNLNRLWERAREPAEIRNRTLHDPWATGIYTGQVRRLEITARRTLKFGFKDIKIESLKNDHEKVRACVFSFLAFRNEVKAALPSLPDIPDEELEPIVEAPPSPK